MKKFVLLLFLLLGLVSYGSNSDTFSAGNLLGTSNFVVESGISGVVTLSIPEISLTNSEQDKFFDSFFYRHNQFIFGRRGNGLYFNFFDGKRWTAYIHSDIDFALEANRIYQLAFTLQVHEERSQGELWTDVVLYADGREVGRARVLDRKPAASNKPVQFAQAIGFGNGWNCAGKIYSREIFNKTLDSEVIAEIASKEKRIKFIPEGGPALPKTVENKIAAFNKKFLLNAQNSDKAFINAVTVALQCWAHKYNEKQFNQLLHSLTKTFNVKKRIVCPEWNLLVSKHTMVILSAHDNQILAWYDIKNNKNLIDTNNSTWFQVSYIKNNKKHSVSAVLPQVKLSAINKPLLRSGKYSWKSCYQHDDFTAQVHYTYVNDSLRYKLAVEAASGVKLHETVYPHVKLVLKKAGDLLIPRMSGAVKRDAAAKRITYSGNYPSGHVSMQLGAYYNKQSGIYFATEDGRARAKTLLFRAGKRGLEIAYCWPVKYPKKTNDKSYFAPECDAVLSWFTGDWYDAGLLYKDFLKRSAIWYKSAKSVTAYPKWFKNNTLWLILHHRDDSGAKLAKLRKYLELPFSVHYYNWFGTFDRDYPHHRANPQHYLWMQAIKKMDINIIPYTNGRLWEFLDRRDTDYRYTLSGKPDAVKLANGTVQTEFYKRTCFAVMCSACPNWQNELKNLAKRVLSLNVDGVYMDQIGAARPRLCFDKTHSHAPNDPDSWYMAGYRKMLLDLHRLYPRAVWTTEDNAEPYVGLMHGLLPWRWMVDGNVPLFNLLYHGKTEMVGRSFGGDTPRSRKVKIYQQLLQGEQLGWCGLDLITRKNQADFRLLVKQAMHLRLWLLDYFQQGSLLRTPEIKNIQYSNLKWGNFSDQVVSTPDIAASAWALGNRQVLLLVNQGEKSKSFTFNYPTHKQWSFSSISGQGKCKRKGQDFTVTLPVDDIAIILSGIGDDFVLENDRLKKLFNKISKFEKR